MSAPQLTIENVSDSADKFRLYHDAEKIQRWSVMTLHHPREDFLCVKLAGRDMNRALANGIRRSLRSTVPSLAVEVIRFIDNTVVPDTG